MTNVQMLFRASLTEEGELETAKKHFPVVGSRSLVQRDALIVPRYSSLPYYDELERDVLIMGGRLINSYHQHLNVAQISRWYPSFQGMTPKTWFSVYEAYASGYEGPFVLKGETNSRKHLWKTHMYAPDRASMRTVFERLLDDSLLNTQSIVVRAYEKFLRYPVESIGPPVTNEWRCFFYKGFLLASGFYWSEHLEQIQAVTGGLPRMSMRGVKFIDKIGERLAQFDCPFVVADVAETQYGDWRLVELNDGTMSGLSCVSADALYKNLRSALDLEAKRR